MDFEFSHGCNLLTLHFYMSLVKDALLSSSAHAYKSLIFVVVKSRGFSLNVMGIYGSTQRCVKPVLAGVIGSTCLKHIVPGTYK